ncbi:hypothetical protein CK203_019335 [Vitis vinifera]|uniref:Uncharacterized protein n=1 Tax=Vitis vinifera TaxID=29760 RepID=A0A438J825_VITVI|nr:hypothetical protein CK203_019335 [Vitis vinifera]
MIHMWTGPNTPNIGHRDEIHQLCATTLGAIYEADRLLILPNVINTKRQSSDEKVVIRGGGVRTRGGGCGLEVVGYQLEVVRYGLDVEVYKLEVEKRGLETKYFEAAFFFSLDSVQAGLLEDAFFVEKVQIAVFGLNGDKALELDGFTLAFWQFCCDIVKHEVMGFFAEFHSSGYFERSLNSTFIVLIPKKGAQMI